MFAHDNTYSTSFEINNNYPTDDQPGGQMLLTKISTICLRFKLDGNFAHWKIHAVC